jgi:hypothetical protein
MNSCVLILPAPYQSAGNALAVAMGHDVPPGNTYSVPLSVNGLSPATHYGCHTWATDQFVAIIEAAQNDEFPTIPGVTVEQMAAVIDALIFSNLSYFSTPLEHFNHVLAVTGLQQVTDI